MFDAEILNAAGNVITQFRARNWHLATAESCTGGLIAGALTAISGSSDVIDAGFVTYSNAAKSHMVGVSPALIAAHGAVSEEVARAMAEGALKSAGVDVSLAVTGIAGPGGATETKPVGLVYIALAAKNAPTQVERHVFDGDRTEVRRKTLLRALTLFNLFAS